jgi:hypothetical protein
MTRTPLGNTRYLHSLCLIGNSINVTTLLTLFAVFFKSRQKVEMCGSMGLSRDSPRHQKKHKIIPLGMLHV